MAQYMPLHQFDDNGNESHYQAGDQYLCNGEWKDIRVDYIGHRVFPAPPKLRRRVEACVQQELQL